MKAFRWIVPVMLLSLTGCQQTKQEIIARTPASQELGQVADHKPVDEQDGERSIAEAEITLFCYRYGLTAPAEITSVYGVDGTGLGAIEFTCDGDEYRILYDIATGSISECAVQSVTVSEALSAELDEDEVSALISAVERYASKYPSNEDILITDYDYESVIVQIMERPVALKTELGYGVDKATLYLSGEELGTLAGFKLGRELDESEMFFETNLCVQQGANLYCSFKTGPSTSINFVCDRDCNIYYSHVDVNWHTESNSQKLITNALQLWASINRVEGAIDVTVVDEGYVTVVADNKEINLKLAVGVMVPGREDGVLYVKNIVHYDGDYNEQICSAVQDKCMEVEYIGDVYVYEAGRTDDSVKCAVRFGNDVRTISTWDYGVAWFG